MLTRLEERALLYVTGLTDKEGREAKEALKFANDSLQPACIVVEYTQSSDFLVNFGKIKAILTDALGEPVAGEEIGFSTTIGSLSPLPNAQVTFGTTDEKGEAVITLTHVDDSGAAILPSQMVGVKIVAYHKKAADRLIAELTPFTQPPE